MIFSLKTIVRLGEILLIISYLLLMCITEIDPKPHSRKQVILLKPEENTLGDDINIISNKYIDTMETSNTVRRKKRNLVNMVKKCYKFTTNATSSTCTPFFIRRSKIAHRKTARLKKPTKTIQAFTNADIDPITLKNDKGKIKKLFFPKHSTTSLSTHENQNNYNTSDAPYLSEISPEKVINVKSSTLDSSVDQKHSTYVDDDSILHDLIPKDHVNTMEVNLNKTEENYISLWPYTDKILYSTNLRTQENIKDESLNLTLLINTTTVGSTFNASAPRRKSAFKNFHLKDIFRLKKVSPFTTIGFNSTFGSENVSQPYTTVVGSDLLNTTEYFSFQNFTPTSPKPKDNVHFKNILEVHHKVKHHPSNVTAEKHKPLYHSKPTMELGLTTHAIETQIPSFSEQTTVNKVENLSEQNILSTTIPSIISSKRKRKYMNFQNIFRGGEGKTTSNISINSHEIGRSSKSTFKINSATSNFHLGSSYNVTVTKLEPDLQCNTLQSIESVTDQSHLKKQRQGNHHAKFETTSNEVTEVCDQGHKQTIVVTKSFTDNSEENDTLRSETTTTHNPFKIKFLMRFKSPISSTQNMSNESTTETMFPKTQSAGRANLLGTDQFNQSFTTEPMYTNKNLNSDLKTLSELSHDSYKPKSAKGKNILTKTDGQEGFSIRDKNSHDSLGCESEEIMQCSKSNEDITIFKDVEGFKKHKSHSKNKNHKHFTRKPKYPGVKFSPRPFGFCNSITEENFKNKFNVTFYRDNDKQFRDWFLGKTTRYVNHKNEEKISFKWCVMPKLNKTNATLKYSTRPINIPCSEMPTEGVLRNITSTTVLPRKKFKHFFKLRTSKFSSTENKTITFSVFENATKKLTADEIVSPKQTTKRYNRDKTVHDNIHFAKSSFEIKAPSNTETTLPVNSSPINHDQLKNITSKTDDNSTGHNMSLKVYRHEKIKQFFNKFHTPKAYSPNNSFVSENNFNSTSQAGSVSITHNSDYGDYFAKKKSLKKKYLNRTVILNASDVNDTSLNVMAYVMKPLDSLVSVFKALSPNSVTKIGDVNATDIKNGSLPSHLQPPNSSIVILAVNNTNATGFGTSRDIHESKLGLALDVLGGMYHCVFNSFVEARPQDVHFYLYTRSSPEEPEELFLPQELLGENSTAFPDPVYEGDQTSELPLEKREVEESYEYEEEEEDFEPLDPAKSEIQSKLFNVRAETKVLIHGYLQDHQTDIMVSMKEAYLSRGPYNVVVVDWSVLVGEASCYPVVAGRGLRQVGGLLAHLLDRLIEAGVAPSRIHVVGFSLGAHVAGHAGTLLRHGLLSRITGLDPALPYVPMEADVSLDSDDAVFVDIIHSAAGLLGQSGPMGHVDFYPNGGSQQPGCETSSLSCSHRRAALYFIESITSDVGFPATRCESWHHFQADNCTHTQDPPDRVLMGEPCPNNTSGKFYLVTGYKSPFALPPKDHVKVKKSLLFDLFYESEDL